MTKPLGLSALKKLCEAATPGPWTPKDHNGEGEASLRSVRTHDIIAFVYEGNRKADLSFIAAARVEMPRLIEEVDHLENVIENGFNDTAHFMTLNLRQENTKLREENQTMTKELNRLQELCHMQEQFGTEYANKVVEENTALKAEVESIGHSGTFLSKGLFDKMEIENTQLKNEVTALIQAIGNKVSRIIELRRLLRKAQCFLISHTTDLKPIHSALELQSRIDAALSGKPTEKKK